MSDTENTTVIRPEIIGKISLLSLGVPAAALADENVNKATMGVIVGRATGLVRRTKKNEVTGVEEKLRGLRGTFRAMPADPKRAEKRSSVLYLPDGLGAGMLDRFEEAEKQGEVISIDLAIEAFVERAKNAAGYSWGGRSLLPEGEGVTQDPAVEVMRLAGLVEAAPALTDQTGQAEAPAADPVPEVADPAPAKAGSGKKS